MRFIFVEYLKEVLLELCSEQKLKASSTVVAEIAAVNWEKIKAVKYDSVKYGFHQAEVLRNLNRQGQCQTTGKRSD